jgi:hypothetical protein
MAEPAARPTSSRKPVTSALIRAASKVAPAARPELPLLLVSAAEALTRVLGDYTSSPVRAEPDGFAVSQRDTPIAGAEQLRLTSPRGDFNPQLLADRRFIMGLCEAGFGGSGTEAPHDGEERPLSRTESRLLKVVLQEFAARLPPLLADCFGTSFTPREEDTRRRPQPAPLPVDFVAGRILVHVFGYSGEVLLLLPEAELPALTARAGALPSSFQNGEAERARYHAAVLDSAVTLTAQLPQELMPLSEVVQLRKGQLLKFHATALTPVLLAADGATLRRARFAASDAAWQLEIIET